MNSLLTHFPKEILCEAAERFGTPLYVYSKEILEKQAETYINAFEGMDAMFCYAMKANSCKGLCSVLAKKGFGADVVSGGELYRALKAGFPSEKIIFSGTGKTADEIEYAIKENILFINAESAEELNVIESTARRLDKKCRFSVRINPEVDPHTHAYISTGMAGSKFGVSFDEAFDMYVRSLSSKWIEPVGAHFHIGSQITSPKPYIMAAEKMRDFLSRIEKAGVFLKYADIGGGWGVPEGQEMPSPSVLREAAGILSNSGRKIILEPGRSVMAPCGIILAKVLYIKSSGGRDFAITDCGMNDFIRPALYGARHPVEKISNRSASDVDLFKYDIAGPVCESSDFIAKDVMMPKLHSGDLIAVLSAGAYCFSMGSCYNSRPRPAEVMIEDNSLRLLRRRETIQDMICGEI